MLARAQELAVRQFGVDLSLDPRIEQLFAELAEASIERMQKYKWPVEQLHLAITQVAAERIVALQDEIVKLRKGTT